MSENSVGEMFFLALIFLFGGALLAGMQAAIERLGKGRAEELTRELPRPFKFLRWFFSGKRRELMTFTLMLSRLFYYLCFVLIAFDTLEGSVIYKILSLLISTLIADFIFQGLSLLSPKGFFKVASPLAALFLGPLWPFAFIFFKILKKLSPKDETQAITSFRMKDKILEIFQDSAFAPFIDSNEKKLLLSVISFKERIAREVMVPRIDVYALPIDTTVNEATSNFLKEGYSRIPIYKESIDNVVGVLYYKDLLRAYAQKMGGEKNIEELVKPVLYTPETKKISVLLQEFRSKKIHLAIVVDEYGGTEGIVTIEDILEELVGEISDEYDIGEEALYSILPSGSWILDAKMTIIDIEEELGIRIPPSPEYDTIGGYVFHKAGAIPSKGWRLHHDDFDLEILSSSERAIEKIRITPHQA